MFFGINDANAPVTGQTVQRTYHTPAEGIPAAWDKATPAGLVPIDSIRPDPSEVVAGSLDAQLVAYWQSLPLGALVTLWHEANDPNQGETAATIKAMHQHAEEVATQAPNVRYGVIIGGYPLRHGQDLTEWVPILNATSWIGCDTYATAWDKPAPTPEGVFGPFVQQAGIATPLSRLVITETNTDVALVSPTQEEWLTSCAEFAISEGFWGFCPWASPTLVPQIPAVPVELLEQLAQHCTGEL